MRSHRGPVTTMLNTTLNHTHDGTDTPLGDRPGASGITGERPLVIAAEVLVIATLVLLPLVYVVVPPIQDYPNHLARMQAIAVLDHDPALSRFYAIEWSLIPNLVMDLVVPPLAHSVSV